MVRGVSRPPRTPALTGRVPLPHYPSLTPRVVRLSPLVPPAILQTGSLPLVGLFPVARPRSPVPWFPVRRPRSRSPRPTVLLRRGRPHLLSVFEHSISQIPVFFSRPGPVPSRVTVLARAIPARLFGVHSFPARSRLEWVDALMLGCPPAGPGGWRWAESTGCHPSLHGGSSAVYTAAPRHDGVSPTGSPDS